MTDLPRPKRPWDKTPVAERDYFEVLGPGLVAVVAPKRPGGGDGGWSPPTGGAWVHVGPLGEVHAFTGKAEVGQGTRGALTMIVAEELRTRPGLVTMVMADTDLCPWDMGTFGSRSMPDASNEVAVAAAGARESLVDEASRRAHVPRSELEAVDGTVQKRGAAAGTPYGELVAGARRLAHVERTVPRTPASRWSTAGHPFVDVRAVEVVTGARRYASDLRRPGMRHGAILQPPRYGSRLRGVDLTALRDRPELTAVHEGGFVGVVAPSAREARAALGRVRSTWDDLPQPGSAEVEAYLRSHPSTGDSWDTDERTVGEVDSALSTAPVRVTATYRTAYIAHVPLETHCAVAEWTGDRLTVWVGSQTPFIVRDELADALGIAVDDVRVIIPPTGAGFGGKHGAEVAIAAARLSRAAGAPVRVGFDREEEFRYAYLRPMAIVDVDAGALTDGTITAWRFHNVNAGGAALLAPYAIPNQKVDNELSESPLPQGPYRSLAAAANNFARESAVDELAAGGGVDPLSIRSKNIDDPRLRSVLEHVAALSRWADRKRGEGTGYGLAVGREKGSYVATVAQVHVDAERHLAVERLWTAFEAGAQVHPANLRSQVEGAATMALGGALFEEIRLDRGVVTNPRLSEYRLPRFSDQPTVEVELLDRPDLPSAGGGETPLIAVAPAIANALFDATGLRIRSLPLAPDGTVPSRAP